MRWIEHGRVVKGVGGCPGGRAGSGGLVEELIELASGRGKARGARLVCYGRTLQWLQVLPPRMGACSDSVLLVECGQPKENAWRERM